MKKVLLVCLAVAGLISGCTGAGAPAITITFGQGAVQAIDQGQSVDFTVTVNDAKGVTWTLTGMACPACGMLTNVTLTSVTYKAPASNVTVMVTATSVTDTSKHVSVTVMVSLPPTITTTSLPGGTQGTAYGPGASVQATGGAGTVTFSVTAGTFPPGLTLASNGSISGTPNATAPAQTFNFTVTATDSSNASTKGTDSKALSIVISSPPAPKLSPAGGALPAGTEGTPYSQTITVNMGLAPFTTTVTGTLPAGLTSTVSPAGSTVTIAGKPTGPPGPSNFTITAKDSSNPQQSDTQNYSITINLPPAPKLSPAGGPLPAGTEGTVYSQNITVSNGLAPFTFTVTAGSLPAGLSKSSSGSTFTISGTPTGPNGPSNFTLQVTDSSNPTQSDTQNYSITVNLPPPPSITTTSLPNGNQGSPYNQTISATGGLKPYTFSLAAGSGPLPTGLMLTTNASNQGVVSGTPTAQGTFNFSITVTDSSNPTQTSSAQAYTVIIAAPAPLSITTTSPLPNGAFNTAYSTTIKATGGIAPYTFSLDVTSSPLPAGLTFTNDAVNNQGVISGTPTTAGMFTNIIVDVHDSQGTPATASATFTLTITAPAIVISPATGSLPPGTQNTAYSATITATGGVQPYTISLDAASATLPAGLMLVFTPGTTSATISGTPTATGTTNGIIVDVKDSEQPPVTRMVTYSLTINTSAVTCPLPLGGSESVLSGAYAARFIGWSDTKNGMLQFVASFLPAGASGNITNGVVDINGVGQTPAVNQAFTGCFSLSAVAGTPTEFRGKMIWNFSTAIFDGRNTVTFAIAVRSDGKRGRFIEFDDTNPNPPTSGKSRGSGEFRLQKTTLFTASFLTGPFAFASGGADGGGSRSGVIGVFTGDGVSLIPSGALDFSQKGSSLSNVAFTGTFTPPDTTFGRGMITITIPNVPINGVPTTIMEDFAYYIEKTGQAFIQTTVAPNMTGRLLLNGVVLAQAVPAGGFTAANSLNAPAIFSVTGFDESHNGTFTAIGRVTSPGDGTFSGIIDQNADAPTMLLINQPLSGTVSIGSNGLGVITITNPSGAFPFSFAAVVPNGGFLMDGTQAMPGHDVNIGFLQPQSLTSFSGSFIFGSDEPATITVSVESGVVTFSSNITGTSDQSGISGLSPGGSISAAFTIDLSIGRGVITPTGGGSQLIFWVIKSTDAVIMDTKQSSTTQNVTILNLHQ